MGMENISIAQIGLNEVRKHAFTIFVVPATDHLRNKNLIDVFGYEGIDLEQSYDRWGFVGYFVGSHYDFRVLEGGYTHGLFDERFALSLCKYISEKHKSGDFGRVLKFTLNLSELDSMDFDIWQQ